MFFSAHPSVLAFKVLYVGLLAALCCSVSDAGKDLSVQGRSPMKPGSVQAS